MTASQLEQESAMSDESASPAVTDLPEEVTPAPVTPPRGRVVRVILDPSSRIPTYVGIAVVAIGFALIGIAWAKIAPLLNVSLQLPYLVSAGFTGLALVMLGLIVINIAAKRQDSAELTRQLDRLVGVLTELQQGSDEEG